ncbi:MAG TPA: glucan 1,4-alpha-glucosidase [Candidatus Angelobacter sp.]|nr:glucan 1,4-alpha-glucosidase [Candidatus Angelobacter sp.]
MGPKRFPPLLLIFLILIFSPACPGQNAPGAPGTMPTWTPGSKEGVGTATTTDSRVWFTLEGGILSEVYYPRLDTADVRTLEFAVSDGKRVWIESRDLLHSVKRASDNALVFQQTSRDPAGSFRLTKTYVTDPQRDSLLIDVQFSGPAGDSLYMLYDPALKNSGYGDSGFTQGDALIVQKEDVATALICGSGLAQMSSGFAGTSDGYTDILLHHQLKWTYARADNGNVVQAAKIVQPAHFTLALGFGGTPAAALENARASLKRTFAAVSADYVQGWAQYVGSLRTVNERYRSEFQLAAMVLKAHEDKTYRGAMIASMSIPWGFAVNADQPTVGGYHLIWARDLYEVATGLLAAGDRTAAERALDYLLKVQQKPDGSFPQNSWLDGRPYWTALQMDEVSYPIVLAWQLGKTDHDLWVQHLRPAAEFVASHGPATQQDRWEEVSGYSPSTIAAEIAGLICAGEIARKNGANDDADRYVRTAEEWAGNIEKWLVTTSGHLGGGGGQGYYLRIDNNTDPNDGYQLDVHNGGGVWDERDVVDQGFIELVRLGIRPADDATIAHSLEIIDSTIRVETPNGPSFRRYNHDGYGDTAFGGPWQGQGIGRIWPIFTGERGEYEVARGRDATLYLDAMLHFANAGGMIPEQVWDRAEATPARFVFGQGTGSATPLAWSMAQFIRLVVCVEEKRIVEQPEVVAAHFLKGRANGTKAASLPAVPPARAENHEAPAPF